jgi:hypothetical protein
MAQFLVLGGCAMGRYVSFPGLRSAFLIKEYIRNTESLQQDFEYFLHFFITTVMI